MTEARRRAARLVWLVDEAMHNLVHWSPRWLCNLNERFVMGPDYPGGDR